MRSPFSSSISQNRDLKLNFTLMLIYYFKSRNPILVALKFCSAEFFLLLRLRSASEGGPYRIVPLPPGRVCRRADIWSAVALPPPLRSRSFLDPGRREPGSRWSEDTDLHTAKSGSGLPHSKSGFE